MKKLLIFYLFCPLLAYSQIPDEQVLNDTTKIGVITRTVAGISQNVKDLAVRTDTLTKQIDRLKPETCLFCQSKLSGLESWLVATPLLLFIIASLYVLARLRAEGYRISDALKENYTVDVAKTPEAVTAQLDVRRELKAEGVEAADGAEAAAPFTNQIRPQSTSRLIAFFAGMASIVMSITAVTFFFYVYLRTGQEPKFENLWNVVLGLGVGVAPYAFSRISDAISPPRSAQ